MRIIIDFFFLGGLKYLNRYTIVLLDKGRLRSIGNSQNNNRRKVFWVVSAQHFSLNILTDPLKHSPNKNFGQKFVLTQWKKKYLDRKQDLHFFAQIDGVAGENEIPLLKGQISDYEEKLFVGNSKQVAAWISGK